MPHGLQELAGVPFELNGLLQLFGAGPARGRSIFRDRVAIDLGGRPFGQLHVLHGTAYSAPVGTPVARLVFRYTDGTRHEQPILYGHHVRDWWRAKVELPARVVDPQTKVVWRGTHRQAEAYAKTLRLYRTVLANPQPDKPVARLELVSAKEEPAWVILAMTTDSARPGSAQDNTLDLEADNPPLPGRLLFHVVRDADGQPVAGATVEVSYGNRSSQVPDLVYRTDETGSCTIELTDPPPSLVHAVTSRVGFAPQYVAWFREGQGDPASRGIPKEYTLRLPPAVPIGGVVQDESGQPVGGVELRLTTDSAERDPASSRLPLWDYVFKTDAEGRWRCDFMAPFKTDFRALISHEEYAVSITSGSRRWRKLAKDKLLEHSAVITVSRGGQVRGVVWDAEGQPVEGASVFLGDQGSSAAELWASTDGQGYYEFHRAQLGEVTVKVQVKGHATAAKTLEARADMPAVDFELRPAKGLRDRVVDAAGQPLAGVTVIPAEWRNQIYSDSWRGTTDAEGNRVGAALWGAKDSRWSKLYRDGQYAITLTDQVVNDPSGPASFCLKVEADGYRAVASRPFKATEGAAEWNVDLATSPNCSGVVRLRGGRPCGNAQLCFLSGGAGPVVLKAGRLEGPTFGIDTLRADVEGRFSFPPPLDDVSLLVLAEDGYAHISASQLGPDREITIDPWGTIVGTMRYGRVPASETTLTIEIESGQLGAARPISLADSAVTDAEGGFRFERVPPTRIRILKKSQATSSSYSLGRLLTVDVMPAEVTRIDLGGTGRPVVVRYRIPEAIRTQVAGTKPRCNVFRVLPRVRVPLDLKTAQEHSAWLTRWNQTEEGKARSRLQEADGLIAVQEENGMFRAEGVTAGEFAAWLFFPHGPGEMPEYESDLLRFSVPDTGQVASDEPLDVGELIVRAVHQPRVGEPAPEFQLPSLDGTSIGLSAFRGSHLLLHLWGAPDYPPHRDALQALATQLRLLADDPRLALLGMYFNCHPEDAQSVTRTLGIGWPQVHAGDFPDFGLARFYGLHNIVLIGPDGVIQATELKPETLRDAVAQALSGEATPR